MKVQIIKKVFSFVFPHTKVRRDQIKTWLKINFSELDDYIDSALELRSDAQNEVVALWSDTVYANAFSKADSQLISLVAARFEERLQQLEVAYVRVSDKPLHSL